MEWHRANGIERAEDPSRTRRPYLYGLPVLREDLSDYLSYPTNNELGVSLVLTDMTMHVPDASVYPELLAKKLVWFVKHLCERTDMANCGVPLRIGITYDVRDIAIPYLNACNFPMSAVDWFESRESVYTAFSKFDAMRQPLFDDIKRIIHLDLMYLIGTSPTQKRSPLFSETLKIWKDQVTASGAGLLSYRSEGVGDSPVEWNTSPIHPIWEVVQSIYGTKNIREEWDRWTIEDGYYNKRGGIIGFLRDFLWDEAEWNKINQLVKVVDIDDQTALSLYVCYERWQESDNANLSGAFRWDDYSAGPKDLNVFYPFCPMGLKIDPELFYAMHY